MLSRRKLDPHASFRQTSVSRLLGLSRAGKGRVNVRLQRREDRQNLHGTYMATIRRDLAVMARLVTTRCRRRSRIQVPQGLQDAVSSAAASLIVIASIEKLCETQLSMLR